MKHLTIQGVSVPALGLGTWELTGGDCVRSVEMALEMGYRHIDTAQIYGNELQVGIGIQNSGVDRSDLFLTTKVWRENAEPRAVRSSTEASLDKLRTEYVDLLLLHWPVDEVPLQETLEAMMRLRDDGKAAHIGVSNFPAHLLEEALKHAPIFCNQVEYHPYLAQKQLLTTAQKHDLLFTAYSPLARGSVVNDPELRKIGEKYGKSAAQVTLRWLMQQNNVCAVPKATSKDHLQANLEIFDFQLSDGELDTVHHLARGERIIDPPFAPQWKT